MSMVSTELPLIADLELLDPRSPLGMAKPEASCCCSARPLAVVSIPGGVGKAAQDLWLCGNHYNRSRANLGRQHASAWRLA